MSIFAELTAGITTRSAEETQSIALRLAQALPVDATLALHGNLGVGKTTFVQGLAKGFGVTDAVTSPTFNIFTLHRGGSRTLVHLDAYRLENDRQIDSLMLDDFLTSPFCLAVEWPEKIATWLPRDALHVTLSILDEHRHHVQLSNNLPPQPK
ncbi:MAG: tRNA (adenosine(37)-N6)-threonylcarbamoyltransferase complex ATPase subunit type 1 TsaE [Verrucomicrobia bacterium]|nr:tRNA (adenosine(37)-N6)-threonylcarbamoyltransferase complex ATPase subunit type 1 TsaE [Verrucomicrobiota bacterium]